MPGGGVDEAGARVGAGSDGKEATGAALDVDGSGVAVDVAVATGVAGTGAGGAVRRSASTPRPIPTMAAALATTATHADARLLRCVSGITAVLGTVACSGLALSCTT